MNHVVIFAGGVGSRMGGAKCPKQFLKIEGKEIIAYTIEVFQNHPQIDAIHVACHSDWLDYMRDLIKRLHFDKIRSLISGGKTGQLSIYNGLIEAEKCMKTQDDIVLIHDGVRPIIDADLVSANIESVKKYGNAISSAPATETVLLSDDSGIIRQIEDRSVCFYARAPQSFFLADILSAHRKALSEGQISFIDSCSLMKHYGASLNMVPCSSDNIKVTTPKDFYLVRTLLKYNRELVTAED